MLITKRLFDMFVLLKYTKPEEVLSICAIAGASTYYMLGCRRKRYAIDPRRTFIRPADFVGWHPKPAT